MDKKNHNELKIKKKIKEYKKRLNNLKLQGFTFSKDIYEDLETIEKKILKPTLFNQIAERKVPVFSGIIGIFLIVLIIGVINNGGDISKEPMKLTVDFVNGTAISESVNITGNAYQPNGIIELVQVKIDEDVWKEANGTNPWSYTLSIDTLRKGNHSLQIRCFNGEEYEIINRTFLINEEPLETPSVEIIYPSHGETLSGTVTIRGTALAGNQDIQRVNIRFEEGGDWITVNGTTNWNYDWNTTNLVTDVPDVHTIEVQCHTNQSKSEIQGILVIIKKDTDKETDLPSFDENKYFQWYFPPGFIPKPNQEYKMKIYYRQRTIEKKLASRHPIAIEIDGIQDKEDYLTVSFPREKISTTPDNETYVYEYTVSLSDDAPKDNLIVFTVAYSYYADISPLNLNLFDWNPFKTSDTQDVFIIPGSW